MAEVPCTHLGHPIVHSMEPGEDWSFCYLDDVAFIIEIDEGATGA